MPDAKPTSTTGHIPSPSPADEELGTALEEGVGKESPEAEVFYDASKVRPELKASYVEMQRAYTQKTQELARLRKEAESRGGSSPEDARQAEILRGLLQDTRVVKFLQKLRGEDAMPSGDDDGGTEDDSYVDPSVSAVVEKRVGPLKAELTNLRAQVTASQEWTRFVRAHPDYTVYQEGMVEAMKENPSRNYEDAYSVAFTKHAQKVLAQRRQRSEARNSAPEGGGSGAQATKREKVPSSFQEAVDASLEELSLTRKDIHGM